MNVIETTPQEYEHAIREPFSVFDSVAFCQLNALKVDAVKYLIFNDGKNRFGIIAGIKDGELRAPFSAPYACFSMIAKNNKITSYASLAPSLLAYADSLGLERVRVSLPPAIYNEGHIAKLYNSFFNAGFNISGCDLNFQYDLSGFGDSYEMSIDPKARQKLRAALRNGLLFEKTTDVRKAYEIIRANRKAKNYPLWMTYENVLETIQLIKTDFFLVHSPGGEGMIAIASAMVYEVAPGKAQIIYWGNLPGTDDLRPMNFLAFHVLAYYHQKGNVFIDIGPSTENSVPNFGLCDFKQAIGCATSAKITFEADI